MNQKILQGENEKRNGIYYEYDPFSKPLGEGGMGVVYKGFRVNVATGGRQVVAIKAMKDGLPDEVYGRARREASIQLKNDNLVEMMGFISTNEQELGGRAIRRYYVVSEFLNGVVLTDLLKGNFKDRDGIEIPYAKQLYTRYVSDKESTVVEIIKRVLAGIMALHDKGFIHRDIDPSNIMVTKEGNLKMIDFGIAKDVTNLNTHDGLHTSAGKFIGKAEYAAPELVLGDVRSQNFMTDVYAIGILFYQLLVGKLPFDGPQYDVLQKQLKKNLPVGNIPHRKYRSIVKKATAKNQSDRYKSCIEMRMAIDTATDGFDWGLAGKAAAIIVVAGGLGFGGFKYFTSPKDSGIDDSDKIVVVPSEPQKSTRDDSLKNVFQNALAQLHSNDKATVKSGWKTMQHLANDENLAAAKREIGVTMFVDHKVKLSSQVSTRRTHLGLTSDQNQAQSKKILAELQNDSIMTGEALVALGISCYRNSEWAKAKEALRSALPKLKQGNNEALYNQAVEYLNNMH